MATTIKGSVLGSSGATMVNSSEKGKEESGKTTKPTTSSGKGKGKSKVAERPIKYDKFESVDHLRSNKNGPIRVAMAKRLLGWEDEDTFKERVLLATPNLDPEQIDYPSNVFLTDQNGKRVWCSNNTNNRPYDNEHALRLAQDILNRNWADSANADEGEITCNGESIIIGKTGLVLSGQHRLVAVIYASQIAKSERQRDHWETLWKNEEPAIEAVVTYGVSEDARVIRTLDNVKPRTFADVLYTDPTITGGLKSDHKTIFPRVVDYAIKFLWERTGEKDDSYSPRRTHSEAMEFLSNHSKLKECAVFILAINGSNKDDGKRISRMLSLGDAAGCMYLMATSDSDGDTYRNADNRRESLKCVNFDKMIKAKEFWQNLATHDDWEEARKAMKGLNDVDKGGLGNRSEKLVILAHLWEAFLQDSPFDSECLRAKTRYDDKLDKFVVAEWPSFGGLDLGPKKPTPKKEKLSDIEGEEVGDTEQEEGSDLTQEESERRDAEAIAEAKRQRQKDIEEHNEYAAEKMSGNGALAEGEDSGLGGWEEEEDSSSDAEEVDNGESGEEEETAQPSKGRKKPIRRK